MKIPTPHRISASRDPFPRRPAPEQGERDWARACIGLSRGIASPRANMPFPMPRYDHQVYLEDFDFEANRWNGEPSPAPWARACTGVSRGIASPRANMPFPVPRHDHQVYLEDFDFEANRWNGEPSPVPHPAAIERLKEQGATANTRERWVLGVARKPEIEIRLPAAPRNSPELRYMTQEDKQALREALTRNQDLYVDKWAEDRGVKFISAVICASLILKKICERSLHDDREPSGSRLNANQRNI